MLCIKKTYRLAAILALVTFFSMVSFAETFDVYSQKGKSKLIKLSDIGVGVQHFTVPYKRVCTQVDFFLDSGNVVKRFPQHSLILRIYDSSQKLIKTKLVRCNQIKKKTDWISVKGLNLPTGKYRIELFTNSNPVKSYLKLFLFSNSRNTNGYAASGWRGGKPLEGDFKVRLVLAAGKDVESLELGNDTHNIISNNKANYPIVLSMNSAKAELYAAEFLQDNLREITGVTLPIITADQYQSGPMIAVGFNSKLPSALSPAAFGELNDQELLIQPTSDILLLAGGSPAGTLYAVYEYLYRLGMRWFTPEFKKLPKLTNVPLPQVSYRYSPSVLGRSVPVGNNGTMQWRSWSHLTKKHDWISLGEKYGFPYSSGPDMHTFWRLISKSVLKKHPDWLCMKNGKRELPVGTTWGLCLSNPKVRKYVVARTIDYARKHPMKRTIWVGQNDGSAYCTCDKCKEFYKAHGDRPSSIMLQLANELSDALEKELPGRTVKTLAYNWTLKPPENMTARDNIMVMFCPMGSFFLPIATDPARKKQREAFLGWKKIVKHMDVYLYFPFDDYWSPAPCTYTGADNIKWCAGNGFDSIMAKISGHGNSFGSESMNLRTWVYSRLMWNPTLDTQQLIDEFISGYYGPAAPAVKQAFKLAHENIYDKQGNFIKHNNGSIVPNYVNPSTVRKINNIFEKTYNSLPSGIYKNHLSFAWIPYLWADFWLGFRDIGRYNPTSRTWSVPMKEGALRHKYSRLVKQYMREHHVNALSELRKFNPALLSIDKMGKAYPAVLLREGNVQAVVIPGVGGRIFDFRNNTLRFAPLKELYNKLSTEYPMFSTTLENVDGVNISEYKLLKSKKNAVTLGAVRKGKYSVQKKVSLVKGVLSSAFTLTPQGRKSYEFRNNIMFDLAKGVFGFYPVLFIEQKDGSWSEYVMGSKSSFHWQADNINLRNCTGRIVLKREKRTDGVLLTLNPGQVKKLSYWYTRYQKGKPAYCGFLRFFIYGKSSGSDSNRKMQIFWSLKILPNISAVVKK